MENKSTTKGTMRKAQIIASLIHNTFPQSVAEFVLELSPEEFKTWNADTLHELEFYFFQIPQKKYLKKLNYLLKLPRLNRTEITNFSPSDLFSLVT
jgi:hypothetical protein